MRFDIINAFAEIGKPERRRGTSFQVRCPFHSGGREINPSARVYIETDSMYCWVCHKSWNPIALVAQAMNVEYGVAASYIESKFGGIEQRATVKQDTSIASMLYAISHMAWEARLRALREFDAVVLAASKGESMRKVEVLARDFGLKHFGRLVQ